MTKKDLIEVDMNLIEELRGKGMHSEVKHILKVHEYNLGKERKQGRRERDNVTTKIWIIKNPEKVKAFSKKANEKYRQSDKGKKTLKKYYQSDKYKEYRQSDKYKEYQRNYQQSDKFKESQKKYRQTEKYKAKRGEYDKRYYQKRKVNKE